MKVFDNPQNLVKKVKTFKVGISDQAFVHFLNSSIDFRQVTCATFTTLKLHFQS